MKQLICYFDGCCEPKNPGGNMGTGSIIYGLEGSQKPAKEFELFARSDYYPAEYKNSNNVAEYMAFENLLVWIIKNYDISKYSKVIQIYGDSNLVIEQMKGNWRIKQGFYIPVAERCKVLLNQINAEIKLAWIPRLKNSYADELSKSQLVKNNVEFKIQKV